MPNEQEKEAEDEKEQATESGQDRINTVADKDTGVIKKAEEKEAKEEIIQADNVDADIGGEEMGTDEEQNTDKRGVVKICADQ